eukprot:TRINITY_DN4348_c0_g1_i2.p2 TRINITY_DN4348_c0_g1~~TRINITY_DN4348_c0_g1_i2.p2  ORF type:complete len:185 (-),score=15.99 TRINITY_DN4348_c0_g1_i2:5-559(-)
MPTMLKERWQKLAICEKARRRWQTNSSCTREFAHKNTAIIGKNNNVIYNKATVRWRLVNCVEVCCDATFRCKVEKRPQCAERRHHVKKCVSWHTGARSTAGTDNVVIEKHPARHCDSENERVDRKSKPRALVDHLRTPKACCNNVRNFTNAPQRSFFPAAQESELEKKKSTPTMLLVSSPRTLR